MATPTTLRDGCGISPIAKSALRAEDGPMKALGYALAAFVAALIVKASLGWVFSLVRFLVGLVVLVTLVGLGVGIYNAITRRGPSHDPMM